MSNPFISNSRKVYQEHEFMEGANNLLREEIYPAMHEEARMFMHTGRVCLLRHIMDNHLLLSETDPTGLKIYVAPPGMDRHAFEKEFANRDFIHPAYFALIADPVRKTIRIEYCMGGYGSDATHFYEAKLNEFEVSQVKAGMARFALGLPETH